MLIEYLSKKCGPTTPIGYPISWPEKESGQNFGLKGLIK